MLSNVVSQEIARGRAGETSAEAKLRFRGCEPESAELRDGRVYPHHLIRENFMR